MNDFDSTAQRMSEVSRMATELQEANPLMSRTEALKLADLLTPMDELA